MVYNRSHTDMDRVSEFFPQSLMGLRTVRGRVGGMRGLFDDLNAFDWQGALNNAPALLRDLYVAHETGQAQDKLLEINLERARRGQSPLDAATYVPGANVNVGVAPATMKPLLIAGGVGLLAVLALSALKR